MDAPVEEPRAGDDFEGVDALVQTMLKVER